jgi:hypothetical protein
MPTISKWGSIVDVILLREPRVPIFGGKSKEIAPNPLSVKFETGCGYLLINEKKTFKGYETQFKVYQGGFYVIP